MNKYFCKSDDTIESKRNEIVLIISLNSRDIYRPQRSWGKVIFSETCVKNSFHSGGVHGRGHAWQAGGVRGGGGGYAWHGGMRGRGAHGGGDVHGIRSMSGRYASYWNVFLLNFVLTRLQVKMVLIKVSTNTFVSLNLQRTFCCSFFTHLIPIIPDDSKVSPT